MIWLVDNDTVFRRLLHLCDNDCALLSVCLVEVGEFLEGIFADDVGVEDEEGRVVFAQDFLCEFERTGGTERFAFNRELYANIILLFVLWSCC